jgi:hypothetical protein
MLYDDALPGGFIYQCHLHTLNCNVFEYFDVYLWIVRHQNTCLQILLQAQELVSFYPECGKSTLNKLKKRRVSPAYPSHYTCSSCRGSIHSADL